MICIEHYIEQLIGLLKQNFGSRLAYVGLQGSYLRGEADANSDIDIMLVIDQLSVADLSCYRSILQSMDHYDKSCGFICSKADLTHWNPLEICHLINSTQDYYGVLAELIPVYTEQDIKNFVKISLNNLYHEICHRYIHADPEKNKSHLPETYKGVFFILQNLHYLTHGEFIGTKAELLARLDGKNHAVLQRAMDYKKGLSFDFDESFELLFSWCQESLQTI